jgi:hypothetical protein
MAEIHATQKAQSFYHTIDKKFNVFATKLQ